MWKVSNSHDVYAYYYVIDELTMNLHSLSFKLTYD